MDLRHLRNMLAVIEEGSLGKAAQRLNISQPALTKSVQRLEEHLGVKLFERDTRGMKPTVYAQSLQAYAKAACVGMAEAENRIRALRIGTEGAIRIAAPPLIALELLPDILVRLLRERPNLQAQLVSQNKALFSDLLEGQFNVVVAMLYDELPGDGLQKQWLFDDRLVLVVRASHPLANHTKITPRDLVDQRWVVPAGDTWSHRRLRLYFEQNGSPFPKAAIESRNPAILKSIIAISDYVGIISRLGVERELASGALKAIELNSPLMHRPIGIVRRDRELDHPAVKSFIALAEEVCRTRR